MVFHAEITLRPPLGTTDLTAIITRTVAHIATTRRHGHTYTIVLASEFPLEQAETDLYRLEEAAPYPLHARLAWINELDGAVTYSERIPAPDAEPIPTKDPYTLPSKRVRA